MSGRIARTNISIFVYFYLGILCAKTLIGYIPSEGSLADITSLGSSLRKKGEFHQAIAAFNEALRIAYDLNDSKSQADCLLQLGVLHWNIGQIEQSAAIYRRASSLGRRLGRQDIEAKCAGYLKIYEFYVRGKKECASGSHEESISHFQTAIELAKKMKSLEHELKCLRQMSINHLRLEMFDKYLFLNEMGLKISKELNHKREEGKFLNNIGLHNLMFCEYSEALVQFQEALNISISSGNNEQDTSTCLTNLGLTYCCLGNYERALPYLEQAFEIDLRTNDEEVICDDLNNLGSAYSRRGRYLKNNKDLEISLDYYLKSLDFAHKKKNKESEIDALNNIGLVNGALGNYAIAMKYYQLAIQEIGEADYRYEACNIYSNMGYALYEMGLHQRSVEHFNKALTLAIEVGRDELLWEVYCGLGGSLESLGNEEAALACYKKAINTIDLIRSRLALDEFRAAFSRNKLKAYESILCLLLSPDQKEEAEYDLEIANVVESAKARSFIDELRLWVNASSQYDDAVHKLKQDDLLSNMSKTISQLSKPDLGEAERKKLLARLEREEEEYTSLLNRIRTQDLDRTQQTLPAVVPISSVQEQCLDQRTAILEYFLGETQSIGILIDEERLVVQAFPPKAEIENSVRAYLKMLSTLPGGKFMGAKAAHRIYRELAAPFEDHISPLVEHLVIVPDGILHYLPFETLIKNDENANGPKYLVELFDISYAPSVSSLFHLMQKKRPANHKKALLAIGDPAYFMRGINKPTGRKMHGDVLREAFLMDGFEISPLPHSRKEIRRVAQCFPKEEVDILLDIKAREEAVKSKPLQGYRIIHFACHALLDEKAPMRSALVLTLDDNSKEDGFLQAREISNLSLAADLVVLSACQTGKGRIENAEGIIGLPRAFFYAGARSMLTTLWKINDKSAAEIMPSFYRHLTEGKNMARALRLAKLEMLKSSMSHPFHWGGLVLNGDYGKEISAAKAIRPK